MGYTGTWIYLGKPPVNHEIVDTGTKVEDPIKANAISGFTSGHPDHPNYEGPDFAVDNNALSMVDVSWTTNEHNQAYMKNIAYNNVISVSTYTIDGEERTAEFFYVGSHSGTFLMSDGTVIKDVVQVVYYTNGDVFIHPWRPHLERQTLLDSSYWKGKQVVGFTLGPSESHRTDGFVGYDFFTGKKSYEGESPIICFAKGTLILTESGPVPVEQLSLGTLVQTRDCGLQPIRWIGSRKLCADTLHANPHLRPVRIKTGALGNATPNADLLVSPQHRVLVRSKIAQRMFSADEVLVAAKQLLALDGIEIAEDVAEVEYYHFLFDSHQIVTSNGADSESLYTGPQALKSVGPAALAEIYALFPELEICDHAPKHEGARLLLTGQQGRKLAQRHAKNMQPLIAYTF